MSKQNAVIVYMSRERDVGLLYRSLLLLYRNFNTKYQYPVVVFHDDIQRITMSKLYGALQNDLGFTPQIKFEYLKFELPEGVSADPSMYNPPLTEFWMGYRHMCRFHSGEIYKHPALLQYDWYWRLDSDSFILSKIDYDVFERMDSNGCEYAYLAEYQKESGHVVVGLWETTKKFIKDNQITPKSLYDKLDPIWIWMFYTNFEIAKFSFFRGKEYMSYYDCLDATRQMYYNRWGDAPIHWYGVHMFLPDSKIWCIKDICYQHSNWIKNTDCIDMESMHIVPEPFKSWGMYEMERTKQNA